MWKLVWDSLDEMPGLVQVVKVKAHLSFSDVMAGRIHWMHWVGNGIADQWAKAGAAAAAHQSPTAAVHAHWTRANGGKNGSLISPPSGPTIQPTLVHCQRRFGRAHRRRGVHLVRPCRTRFGAVNSKHGAGAAARRGVGLPGKQLPSPSVARVAAPWQTGLAFGAASTLS